MKYLAGIVGLVIGLGAGGVIGWHQGEKRAKGNCAFFLDGLAGSELRAQELSAARAYLTQPPQVGIWALSELLKTYNRTADVPEQQPGNRATTACFYKAIIHARLARLYQAANQPEQAQTHIKEALALSGDPNEQALFKKIEILDRMPQLTDEAR